MRSESAVEQVRFLLNQEPAISVSRDFRGDLCVSDSFPNLIPTRNLRVVSLDNRNFSAGFKIDYTGFGEKTGAVTVRPTEAGKAEIEVLKEVAEHPIGDVLRWAKLGTNLFNLYRLCVPKHWSLFIKEPDNPDGLTQFRVRDDYFLADRGVSENAWYEVAAEIFERDLQVRQRLKRSVR